MAGNSENGKREVEDETGTSGRDVKRARFDIPLSEGNENTNVNTNDSKAAINPAEISGDALQAMLLDTAGMSEKLQTFVADSNEVIRLKVVASKSDFDDPSLVFHPLFTHQMFDNEKIFGYRGLEVDLYFSAGSFKAYLDVRYDEKMAIPGLPCDDVEAVLSEFLTGGFTKDKDEFLSEVEREANGFIPPGKMLKSYPLRKVAPVLKKDKNDTDDDNNNNNRGTQDTTANDNDGDNNDDDDKGDNVEDLNENVKRDAVSEECDVYVADLADPGSLEWHDRIQIFSMFFIESASYLDREDDRNMVFASFVGGGDGDGDTSGKRRRLAGFATVVRFGFYEGLPYKKRMRIAQIVTLPYHRGKGHAAALISAVHDEATVRDTLEVTYEEPSDDLVTLRLIHYTLLLRKLGFLRGKETSWSREFAEKVRSQTRISIPIIRRCFEFDLCAAAEESKDEAVKDAFRIEIKRRLYKVHEANKRDEKNKEKRKAAIIEDLKGYFEAEAQEYRKLLPKLYARAQNN